MIKIIKELLNGNNLLINIFIRCSIVGFLVNFGYYGLACAFALFFIASLLVDILISLHKLRK